MSEKDKMLYGSVEHSGGGSFGHLEIEDHVLKIVPGELVPEVPEEGEEDANP